jgi:hypothetical protein
MRPVSGQRLSVGRCSGLGTPKEEPCVIPSILLGESLSSLSKWLSFLLLRSGRLQFTHYYFKPVSEELVQVGHARVPRSFTVRLVDLENRGPILADAGAPEIVLTFEVRKGHHECRKVCIRSVESGREVTASDLTDIRIDDALEMGLRDIFRGSTGDEASENARGFEAARAARDARAARRIKITDALLHEVASVYRANVNDKPTEAVAEHFGRQHRTATHYIKRARERGFLGPAIKGKAGEQ